MTFALSALLVATPLFSSPARAVPGQTLKGFKTWAAAHRQLTGLISFGDDFTGEPSFRVAASDHGVSWEFVATSDGTTIVREFLSVGEAGKPAGTTPIRRDGKGYGSAFFAALYGNDMTRDFQTASLVASVKNAASGDVTRFYRGRHLGYETARGVTVETLPELYRRLSVAQHCARSPQTCGD